MMYTTGTGRGTRLTPAGRREIIRRLVAGQSQQDIQDAIAVGEHTIAKVCREHDMPWRDHRNALKREQIAARLRDGQTTGHIMRAVGACRSTVTRVRKEIGIPGTTGRPKRDPSVPRLEDIAFEPMKREPRPAHWGRPKAAPAVRDLATGQTPWRCDCTTFGVRVTGPTCPACGTAAPWADLMEAA